MIQEVTNIHMLINNIPAFLECVCRFLFALLQRQPLSAFPYIVLLNKKHNFMYNFYLGELKGFESRVCIRFVCLFVCLVGFFLTNLYNYRFVWRNSHQHCKTSSFGNKQWLGEWYRRWLIYIYPSMIYLHFLNVFADFCLLYFRDNHCPHFLI